jgi:hypothetical protein
MNKDTNFTTAEGAEVTQHSQTRKLTETVMYPSHIQRGAESPEFEENKKEMEASSSPGCYVCGKTQADLGETIRMEGHHYGFEWALANSIDLTKFQKDHPDVTSIEEALDSKDNLILLCPEHHRSPLYGVHMITMPAWIAQRYQLDGWNLVSGPTASGMATLGIEQIETKDWYPEH